MDVLTLSNPAFRAYLFYGSILVVKTMAMSLLTARQRFKNKVFEKITKWLTPSGSFVKGPVIRKTLE